MKGRIFAGLFLVFVLVVGAIGLSAIAFNVGVSQGIAQGAQIAQAPAAEGGAALRTYPGAFFYPRPFGFGLGGLLVGGFVLFMLFGLVRMIFWRGAMMGPWASRRGFGRWGGHGMEGVPPMVEEWHKRMHTQESGKAESTSNPQV